MTWSGYIGIENLTLTGPQKATLVTALQALGPSNDPQPSELMHWRVRLDNNAVIYRARFQDGDLTTTNLRQFIANVFSVAVAQVTAGTGSVTFLALPSPVVTLTYQASARLRFVLFGGLAATVAQSNAEVLAYLAANALAWGDS